MDYDPQLKPKIGQMMENILQARERGEPTEKQELALIEFCLPASRACATKWATQIYSRLQDDVDQEIRIGLMNAIKSYQPARGPFFSWAMWWAKKAVRRLKGAYPIEVPAYVRESRLSKLPAEKKDGLQAAKDAYYCGLHPPARDETILQQYEAAEIRASLPSLTYELLMDIYLEGVEWEELEQKYRMTREQLEQEAEKGKELLASLLSEQL